MKPKRREDDLIVEKLPDETLVYDTKRHKAFCLNWTTSRVWLHCDGKKSIKEIAGILRKDLEISHPEDLVYLALERLGEAKLLSLNHAEESIGYRYSRREMARRLGIAGGLGTLLPIVVTVTAPTAASAVSCIPDLYCNANPRAYVGLCCCKARKKCVAAGKCSGAPC
jgi:hypothetical protein